MARRRPVREGPIEVVARGRGAAAESARCRRLLRDLRRAVRRQADGVELLLTGDAEQRALNRRLRGRDRTTDVLSFPAGSDLEPGRPHLGEIAISLPQAARQARAAGWPRRSEMALLLTHGFLHLMGYDHETDDGAMHRLEARLLKRVAGVRIDRRALPWGEATPARAPQGRRRRAPHG
ncbi:MAG TPA: rRNA maturation RNase YbeY [Dongiaceae bacterium]|nr:rRNA maturation RNase YbeY [Dongiaceae bacterium]